MAFTTPEARGQILDGLGAAIDQIGNEVLADGNVRDALREMLRRGVDGRGGLDGLGGPDGRAGLAMVGVLPTLMPEQVRGEWRTESVRYRHLDEAILAARGEDADVLVHGVESLSTTTRRMLWPSACRRNEATSGSMSSTLL